jgi:hypothetical protein
MDGCENYPKLLGKVADDPQDWLAACVGNCIHDFVPFHFYGTNVDQLIDYVEVSPHSVSRIPDPDGLGVQRRIQQASMAHRSQYPHLYSQTSSHD